MAKKPKDGFPKKVSDIKSGRRGRVNTIKPNGADSKVIAPEPQALELGPIIVPEPEDAQRVLKELAELNDRALQAQKRYNDLKELTKQAREKYDQLAEQVLTRLRQTTHASDLPLFTEVREADQARMEAAAEGPADATGEPQANEPAPEQAETAPAPDAAF